MIAFKFEKSLTFYILAYSQSVMKRTSKKHIQTSRVTNKKQAPIKVSFVHKNLKYFFLVLLLLLISISLYKEISGNLVLENFIPVLQIAAAVTGIISLYFDKEKVNTIINKVYIKKEKQTFSQKIKTIFTKKELPATILLIIILTVSAFILFYKLDNFDIFSDEVQVTQGAAGYFHTGEYRQWDFIKEELVGKPYNRAKPHQWIIAQSYKIFGINAFAARFPSAFFGVLLILLMYFTGHFFVKDKYTALLAAFVFSLYFEFIFLGRWARMYAMVYPLFIIVFYWFFRFLTESNSYQLFNSGKYPILQQYFNFNYIYLPFFLIFIFIGIYLHTNIVVLFPIFFAFVIISFFLFRNEKKYITAFIVFLSALFLQISFPFKVNFSRFSFFEINNSEIYTKALFGYPFSTKINLALLFISFSLLFFTNNKIFIKKYLILFLIPVNIWFFFSFIINYAPSYRYISFVTPFIVLLIVGSYILINKILFKRTIQIMLTLLLIVSAFLSFSKHYDSLYVTNTYSPAKPSVAQKVIVNNIKKGDIIFRHWGPKMYLKGIPKSTKFYSVGNYKGKSLQTLYKMMSEHQSGWLIWHKYNENRLDQNFVNYANLYFKKYAGYGIDQYGEEIYYYNKSMLVPLDVFQYQKYMPAANLNLKHPFSIVFDIKYDKNKDGDIFYLNSVATNVFKCYVKNKQLILENSSKQKLSVPVQENVLNRIVIRISTEKTDIFVKGKKAISGKLKFDPQIIKFRINSQYKAYFNNIRIYNFILNKAQINVIEKDNTVSEELFADGKNFRIMFLWKKK